MAQANKSGTMANVRGKFGTQLVFRSVKGKKTVVAQAPGERTGKPTATQQQTQLQFLVASKYAKAILADPDQTSAEAYRLRKGINQSVYARIVEDYLRPPTIMGIKIDKYTGLVGDPIDVSAIDDFNVTGVRVEIHSADDTLLESGDAPYYKGIKYRYKATLANNQLTGTKIKAIATDVPENEGSSEVTL